LSVGAMFEITRLASSSGVLTKRISLNGDGSLKSDGSACLMAIGAAERLRLPNVEAFAAAISGLGSSEAIALGSLRDGLPEKVQVTTARKLSELNGAAPPDLIARTAGQITYRPSQLSLALIDIDTKGMPQAVADRIAKAGGYWPALTSVVPALADVARVVRTSTSSGITRTHTGEPLKGSNGAHVFLVVKDGADVERFLRTLHDRCWLAGFGWCMVGAGGQLLERSLIDRTVFSAERLVFEAPPILEPPLHQDVGKRAPVITPGQPAATRTICPELSTVEQARLRDLKAAERTRLLGPAAEARAKFVTEQAERIASRAGCPLAAARRAVLRQCEGVLLPNVVLPFDAKDMDGATVAEVLADPDRFVGSTLADPIEGVAYGRCKAKIMRRADGALWIHSFAHGRTIYELRYDVGSIEAAIRAVNPEEIADLFIRMLLNADLTADEDQALREMVRTMTGAKARPLDAKIKAARKERAEKHAEAEADRRAAERTDPRPAIEVPLPDAERLPVMGLLDEVLTGSAWPIPPMRDLDGHPVEVRNRPPMLLHELTSEGSNQNEAKDTRLPAPVLPLLTKHDRYTLSHEIERHVEFTQETENDVRAVSLPIPFIDHFVAYRDSKLPRVGAIVTAPLVMPDGALLAPEGLDRTRKLVFQIEPKLMELMPKAADCTSARAANALDYLVSKWLCDVATDFSGKCVSVALALTILERVLLPERPAFFVTAGKRGGGKTTLIMMLILAITGKKPPAAAWSPNEEERRKAILAYLAEGLPAMVWDNIPVGTTIACPTLEKVLTAESYSDRILGQSTTISVPAFTVMTFTGNNIGPKGDMASRSLMMRLEVDRIDPENRTFTHADPVAWTLDNRGMILRALYTILLANQQLRPGQQRERKTRFKTWWHLVGSAVENAAATLVEQQKRAAHENVRYAKSVDFAELFSTVEGDDEEGAALGDVLSILDTKWPDTRFLASDVAKFAEGDSDDAATLRAFFEAARRSNTPAQVSTLTVGKRLASVIGAPVPAGEYTLKLVRVDADEAEKTKRATRFKVRRL